MFKNNVVLKNNKMQYSKLDSRTIILYSLFLCGFIIGIFFIKNCENESRDALGTLLNNHISAKCDSDFISCFCGSVFLLILFIVITFMLGLCAVGTPFICLIPLVFGFVCSCYVSLMLINYNLKGVLYCVMVDLLPYAITTASLMKCCCESTKISINLFGCIAGDVALRGKNTFKEYVLFYLILCIPVIIGALINTICFKIFQGLFVFTWKVVIFNKYRSFWGFNRA